MSKDVLITIVIPVFNREKTILPCVEKILSQDTSNVEILVVDDCSSDNSRSLVKQKFESLENVNLIFSNINNGPGITRNTGIEAASGEYISFVDSDDLVEDNYIITLKEAIRSYNCDVILFSYKRMYHRKKNLIEKYYPFSRLDLKTDVIQYEIDDLYTKAEVSSVIKLIKRELLISNPDIRFPKFSLAEDLFFSLILYPYVRSYVIIPDILYQYHIYEKSQSRLVTNWSEIYMKILFETTDYYKTHKVYDKNRVGLEFLLSKHLLLPNLLRFYNNKSPHNYAALLKLHSELQTIFPKYLSNPHLKKEPKYVLVILWFIKHFPWVFRFVT